MARGRVVIPITGCIRAMLPTPGVNRRVAYGSGRVGCRRDRAIEVGQERDDDDGEDGRPGRHAVVAEPEGDADGGGDPDPGRGGETPTPSGVRRMAPAPRKPTPVMTPAATRTASALAAPTVSSTTSTETPTAKAEPIATSMWVRTPAGLLRTRRSNPMIPPKTAARATRSRISHSEVICGVSGGVLRVRRIVAACECAQGPRSYGRCVTCWLHGGAVFL